MKKLILIMILLTAFIIPTTLHSTKLHFIKLNVEQEDNSWTLLVTGDVMLGRTVNFKTAQSGDYTWAWQNVHDLLLDADLTFINLESPLGENCPLTNSGMIFCAEDNHIKGLNFADIDIVSIANNHALNQGSDGVDFTVQTLTDNNILPVGAKNPTYKTIKNTKIAFLGYDDVECYPKIECANEQNIIEDLNTAQSNSDLVIVMFSWGVEYTHNPSNRQRSLARLAIDNGADLILGNHPHWYQTAETYKGKPIIYSHGNFIFDQMWSQETREGLVGKYYFDGAKLINIEFIPIVIENYGQPRLANPTEKKKILENSMLYSNL